MCQFSKITMDCLDESFLGQIAHALTGRIFGWVLGLRRTYSILISYRFLLSYWFCSLRGYFFINHKLLYIYPWIILEALLWKLWHKKWELNGVFISYCCVSRPLSKPNSFETVSMVESWVLFICHMFKFSGLFFN